MSEPITAIVVSDNHYDAYCLTWLKESYPGAGYFIHAGDSEMSESDPEGWICVRGNHDYDSRFPDEQIISINGNNILLVHGHRFWSIMLQKYNDMAAYAKGKGCNTVIHGHTHLYQDEVVDGVHILCPGSISLPRERGLEKTYMLLRIEENSITAERKVYNQYPKPKEKKSWKPFWKR